MASIPDTYLEPARRLLARLSSDDEERHLELPPEEWTKVESVLSEMQSAAERDDGDGFLSGLSRLENLVSAGGRAGGIGPMQAPPSGQSVAPIPDGPRLELNHLVRTIEGLTASRRASESSSGG